MRGRLGARGVARAAEDGHLCRLRRVSLALQGETARAASGLRSLEPPESGATSTRMLSPPTAALATCPCLPSHIRHARPLQGRHLHAAFEPHAGCTHARRPCLDPAATPYMRPHAQTSRNHESMQPHHGTRPNTRPARTGMPCRICTTRTSDKHAHAGRHRPSRTVPRTARQPRPRAAPARSSWPAPPTPRPWGTRAAAAAAAWARACPHTWAVARSPLRGHTTHLSCFAHALRAWHFSATGAVARRPGHSACVPYTACHTHYRV
jgi:hypothetical protein